MEDDQDMYYKLFNKITDIINDLKAIQQETEELYLSQENRQLEDQSAVEHEKTEGPQPDSHRGKTAPPSKNGGAV